jgi:hypothetical protein
LATISILGGYVAMVALFGLWGLVAAAVHIGILVLCVKR